MIGLIAAAVGLWALSKNHGRTPPRPGSANYSEQANAPAAPRDENAILDEVADSVFGGTDDVPIVVNDGKI